jgi:hypothetical protein
MVHVILALGRLRPENYEFKTSLNYVVRACLKNVLKSGAGKGGGL